MDRLLESATSLFASCNHSTCDRIAKLLKEIDTSSDLFRRTAPNRKPLACGFLAQALSNKNSIRFCEHIAVVSDQLTWTEAPRGKISSFMDDNHAMIQIAGPDHGFLSEKMRFGVFLLAPNTTYPLHSHAAEEIYIPVSGSGRWRMLESSYALKKPGTAIHCQSWMPHAIRSGEEPLLMLWVWVGNISFEEYRIESNAFDVDGIPT